MQSLQMMSTRSCLELARSFGSKRVSSLIMSICLTHHPSMSYNLTGNKKNPAQDSQGNDSKYHVRVFEAGAIESHRNVGMTRGGMILFALLCSDLFTARCFASQPGTSAELTAYIGHVC